MITAAEGIDPNLVRSIRRLSRVLSIGVAILGLSVLIGWVFDISALKSVKPSFEPMKANTAILFVLLGSSLLLSDGNAAVAIRRILALIVTLVAAATIAEYAMDIDLGIDELVFRDAAATVHPGRMAPVTALNFLLLGSALLFLGTWRRSLGDAAVLLAVTISFVSLCGYLYGVTALYKVGPYVSIALHTTLGFLASGLAFFAARPTEGMTAPFAYDTYGGTVLRRALPLLVFLPVLLGWVRFQGEAAGLYSTTFGIAMHVAMTVVSLGGALIFLASSLHESELGRRQADQMRRRASEQFRLAIEAAPTGMVVVDDAGIIALVNAQTEKLFGYSRTELLGKAIEILVPENLRQRHTEHRSLAFRDARARLMGAGRELTGRRKDGIEVPVEVGLNPLETSEGRFVLASVVDISERKQAERQRAELQVQREAAARNAERSRFFELSLDLVCIANTSGHFVQLNPAFASTLGYSIEELLAVPFLDFVHPDDTAATLREIEKLSNGISAFDFTNRYRCKDGSFRWLQWRSIPGGDGTIYAVARDVTVDRELLESLQSKQASLCASLKEREVLLQEVHHRVKNNLQVIWSLINMQKSLLEEPKSQAALEECQSRVQAIALVHEQLYQSKDYARVPLSGYAESLAENIFNATDTARGRVALEMKIESVCLSVDRAIPCGLILNELITNALKHAFPKDRRGVVRVELRKGASGDLLLAVSDDGVGMPAGFDLQKTNSLGMTLVATLAEQLDGRLEIIQGRGTTFRVQFPADA